MKNSVIRKQESGVRKKSNYSICTEGFLFQVYFFLVFPSTQHSEITDKYRFKSPLNFPEGDFFLNSPLFCKPPTGGFGGLNYKHTFTYVKIIE